ncbi:ABC transporter permease [Gracilibacillus caseinilyticus]|uniref:ABC transporter permease n=1 Tax=Gracilibacillus caseinilyticus TaxID=2932256 RepID=A0ABY4F1N8_9BACI|nr:ABC transporter permease [Gracilibacillus caseinilyticus]UOQ49982.1 ABC transporter permease [Gracilibacillus caseinilyticus]
MMDFVKKDIILLLRDRTELMVMILMPFVLMVILGFALGGVMGVNNTGVDINVGLIDKDNEEQGQKQFIDQLQSSPASKGLENAAQTLAPKTILTEVLKEDLNGIVTVQTMKEDDAEEAMAAQEIDAIIIIPKDFTYKTLTNMLLAEKVTSTLEIRKTERAHFQGDIFQTIIEQFTHRMNVEAAIGQIRQKNSVALEVENTRQYETVTDKGPISAMEYYTTGMAVMFAFYVASTIAAMAYHEKNQQVVERILLSGKHPLYFLLGKTFTTIVIVFCQICILLAISSIILQSFQPYDIDMIRNMLLISLVYAITVGSIASLLVALTIRYHEPSISGVFSSGIVSVMALLGGSMIPANSFPEVIQEVGIWTPNGMAMKAYMLVNQGMSISDVFPYITRLLIVTIVILFISLLIFPKRRTQS